MENIFLYSNSVLNLESFCSLNFLYVQFLVFVFSLSFLKLLCFLFLSEKSVESTHEIIRDGIYVHRSWRSSSTIPPTSFPDLIEGKGRGGKRKTFPTGSYSTPLPYRLRTFFDPFSYSTTLAVDRNRGTV